MQEVHAAAILIASRNADALGDDVALVDPYVPEGVRVFAFNHAGNNAFAGFVGCRDASEARNLTRGLLTRGYFPARIRLGFRVF